MPRPNPHITSLVSDAFQLVWSEARPIFTKQRGKKLTTEHSVKATNCTTAPSTKTQPCCRPFACWRGGYGSTAAPVEARCNTTDSYTNATCLTMQTACKATPTQWNLLSTWMQRGLFAAMGGWVVCWIHTCPWLLMDRLYKKAKWEATSHPWRIAKKIANSVDSGPSWVNGQVCFESNGRGDIRKRLLVYCSRNKSMCLFLYCTCTAQI